MDDVLSRQSFCERISNTLLQLLNENYGVDLTCNKCFVQRTRHADLRKKGDFQIMKTMLAILEKKYATIDDEGKAFELRLNESLSLLIEGSRVWEIPLKSWSKNDRGYILDVDKYKAFSYILPRVLNLSSASQPTSQEQYILFCHVNAKPTLHDLRSLFYCEVMQRHFSNTCRVFLSKDSEDDNTFQDIISSLNMNLNFISLTREETPKHTTSTIPIHFSDCMQEPEEAYQCLQALRHSRMTTAFASKVINNYKNLTCFGCREKVSQSLKYKVQCFHICNQTNTVVVQQTQLFYAWQKDCERDNPVDFGQDDKYFCHAGVRNAANITLSNFLDMRREQIKESFESKLQENTDGDDWDNVFKKMRAAVLRLEFLKNCSKSQIKLENRLSTDAIFILYNYSRISMLLQAYSAKVNQGYYPDVAIEHLDYNCFREDAEWQLLIDYLWPFNDVIDNTIPVFENHNVVLNCHHLTEYLHQFCRSISAYYSRHHILVEGLPHLIPTVSARILLMRAAKCVMDQAFRLIGVEPVSMM